MEPKYMLILTSSNNFVTQDFVKHLPKRPEDLRLTFIPTAAEVEIGDLHWLDADRQALVDVGFSVTDFTFTDKTIENVKKMLDSTDFVFVSGGNTFYLLQEMRKSGFASLINEYVSKGMIYGGTSAGSIVAGPDISLAKPFDDISHASQLTDYTGLNLTDVVVFPHWGSEYFDERYKKFINAAYKMKRKIILLTDDQYLLVENGKYSIESI